MQGPDVFEEPGGGDRREGGFQQDSEKGIKLGVTGHRAKGAGVFRLDDVTQRLSEVDEGL